MAQKIYKRFTCLLIRNITITVLQRFKYNSNCANTNINIKIKHKYKYDYKYKYSFKYNVFKCFTKIGIFSIWSGCHLGSLVIRLHWMFLLTLLSWFFIAVFFFFFVFSPLSTSFLNHSLLFLPPFFITLFFLGFFKFFFPLFYYWKYIVHLSNNHYNLKKISFFSFKSEQMLRRQKRSNIGIDLLRSLGFLRAKALRWDSDEMQKFRSKN